MARLAWGSDGHGPAALMHQGHHHAALGHAAMIGERGPAPGRPRELDALTYPPPALPHRPGAYAATTSRPSTAMSRSRRASRTRPGRTTERCQGPSSARPRTTCCWSTSSTAGSHPHTIHFHGIHPADMDGVFEVVEPGSSFTYEFPARPYGMQLYHCHSTPLKKHIHKGLYGAFIIDPPKPRKPGAGARDGAERVRHRRRRREQLLHRQRADVLLRASYPIRVRRSQTVRIYIANLTEFDLINSFHLHGDFFRYYPTGSSDTSSTRTRSCSARDSAGSSRSTSRNTGHVHVPRAPVGVHRARLDGLLRGRRLMDGGSAADAGGRAPGGSWALVPILLLVARRPLFAASGGSLVGLLGQQPAAGRPLRHPPRRVRAGRDPDQGDEPAARTT